MPSKCEHDAKPLIGAGWSTLSFRAWFLSHIGAIRKSKTHSNVTHLLHLCKIPAASVSVIVSVFCALSLCVCAVLCLWSWWWWSRAASCICNSRKDVWSVRDTNVKREMKLSFWKFGCVYFTCNVCFEISPSRTGFCIDSNLNTIRLWNRKFLRDGKTRQITRVKISANIS